MMIDDPNAGNKRSVAPEHDLHDHLKRAKITGRGVEMVQQRSAGDVERVGFLQLRLAQPKAKRRAAKPKNNIDDERSLRYDRCPPEIQRGLEGSRQAEWQKWMKYNAGVILTEAETTRLVK